ncbi:hypothetical protein CC1G_13902 [Coprinopsis cinerea okayama7|uniref:DAGKc domain-containing protein n=1 Tax=Coprinopsis cinerea (strain Okayama-7 / 130 / ATCC MYA-4618 / FGSC 9003) TaxID=240176 RepID=D6RKX0_COPC7|nr:hypothetical protein CC1G_13902 [Coprinopsis cinerea okayama7\|eukprot:XP_002911862.1 hypothetical protein CC1G_13902 [Coprinopsis cinerea okayama7\
MSLSPTSIRVRLSSSHHDLTYQWTDTELIVAHDRKKDKASKQVKSHRIPHENVLRVSYDPKGSSLSVSYIKPKKKKKPASLVVLTGAVQDGEEKAAAENWAETAMKCLYDNRGIKPARRLLVFVNPHGGSGRAVKIFNKTVKPILQAAGCSLKVIQTERHKHAYEVVKAMDLEYDAIVTVSGDGLVHEVLNGLAQHAQPLKALTTPVAPIPAGSGNGLSLNLLGLDNGFDATQAALNAVKGRPMRIDLFSVVQNGKRSISFMSQSLGLMADLDLDTEHLRWMGDTRFMYGFLRGVLAFEACPVQLSIKVAEKDKDKMAEIAHARNQEVCVCNLEDDKTAAAHASLPALRYLPDDNDGWYTIDEPILFVYAGQGPYVGRDYMAFPVSLPDDGLIDIAAMPLSSRKDALANISTAPTGECFWFPKLHYFKAEAYRIKTLGKKGNLSIDGERFPFEEYQVEVHPGLGTLLSPHGRFVAEFKPRSASK